MYMHIEALIMMLTLSGNCATNCEFQLQLAHLQLQLQLQLGKNSDLINYIYNYSNKKLII